MGNICTSGQIMKMLQFVAGAIAAGFVATSTAQAAVVTISSATLASSAGNYGVVDAAGTTLKVSGSFAPLTTIGSGAYQGLWFGSTQLSDTYTFQFNKQVSYFSVLINAMSTFFSYYESIGNFTTNASTAPTLIYTNIQQTAWDGTTVTSGPLDDGTFLMEVQAVGNHTFDRVSFQHIQRSAPNGSVVRQVQYDTFVGSGAVPEPASWALMIAGFLGAGIALRRRQGALAA
jgi:PEP-CTERM motif